MCLWGGIREKDKERDTEIQTNEIVQPESYSRQYEEVRIVCWLCVWPDSGDESGNECACP